MKTETKKKWARFGAYGIFILMLYLFKHWEVDTKIMWSNWAMMVAVYGLSAYENS